MNRLRQETGSADILLGGLAAGAITWIALMAAGVSEEKGKEKIEPCPQGYIIEQEPLENPSGAHQALQKAIAELRSNLPADSVINISDVPEDYTGATDAVFRDGSGGNVILDGDTQIDEPGEVFCHGANRNNVFFSPQAEAGIGAIESVDITVETP